MKNIIIILLTLLLSASCKKSAQNTITVSNTENVDLERHSFTISRKQFSDAAQDKMPVVLSQDDTLVSQTDDMNLDGDWDELAFLITLPANEQKEVTINWVEEAKYPTFTPRTNIRFARKTNDGSFVEMMEEIRPVDHTKADPAIHYQMEGPAWENDKIGFRMYFDPRNGFDIFGKKTNNMVLDHVGIEGNYHKMQDWGMDILKVNNSLGAGALALQWQDSLYRLGKTATASYQKITEGPVRSIFELNYEGWKVGDNSINLRQRITIEAGNPYYQSQVWLENQPADAKLSTGIVKISTDTAYQIEEKNFKILATHDRQAFAGEYLGMAILAANNFDPQYKQTPEVGDGITQTYVYSMETDDQPVEYYFMAGWEHQDNHYSDLNDFLSETRKIAERLSNGPTVVIN